MARGLAVVAVCWGLGCGESPVAVVDAGVVDAAVVECPSGFVNSDFGCILACPGGAPPMPYGCRTCPPGTDAFEAGCLPGGCNCNTVCPTPGTGLITVCGWLRDFESVQRWPSSASCVPCDLDMPHGDGPCGMRIEFFDPSDLEANGAAATPLLAEELKRNDCGRFTAKNITPPLSGELAVRLSGAVASQAWVTTVRVLPVGAGLREPDLDVFALSSRVEAGWSLQASGLLGGESLASVGAAVEVYRHKGAAVGGVDSEAELYFADEASGGPIVLDLGRGVTGTTGGALRLTEAAGLPSGGESELEGCSWPMPLSVIVPGHVSVTTVDSLDGMGLLCE